MKKILILWLKIFIPSVLIGGILGYLGLAMIAVTGFLGGTKSSAGYTQGWIFMLLPLVIFFFGAILIYRKTDTVELERKYRIFLAVIYFLSVLFAYVWPGLVVGAFETARYQMEKPKEGWNVDYWDKEKNKVSSKEYYKNGKLEGVARTYAENGQMTHEDNYIHGLREGKATSWLTDGTIDDEYFFKHGQIDGISKTYYANGQLWEENTWVNGKKQGVTRVYSETGKLTFESLYENNIQIRYYADTENEHGWFERNNNDQYVPITTTPTPNIPSR